MQKIPRILFAIFLSQVVVALGLYFFFFVAIFGCAANYSDYERYILHLSLKLYQINQYSPSPTRYRSVILFPTLKQRYDPS